MVNENDALGKRAMDLLVPAVRGLVHELFQQTGRPEGGLTEITPKQLPGLGHETWLVYANSTRF